MKILSILLVFAMMIIFACTNNDTRSFIPGTYVDTTGSSKSKASDTLIIEFTGESNNYVIHRKTGYNLISKNGIGNREYASEEWTAIYDSGTRTLKVAFPLKLITFYPQSGKLCIRERAYQKLELP
ncbi:MAG: hypothetical protein EOO20_18640 [Chryseobacterium sp.]|nr:MAG: hypothetical protein EOO20_18640 [Chryseobacterium sp.]